MIKKILTGLVSISIIISGLPIGAYADEVNVDIQADEVLANEECANINNDEVTYEADEIVETEVIEEKNMESVSSVDKEVAGMSIEDVEGDYVDGGNCGSNASWALFDNEGYYILVIEGSGRVDSAPWKKSYASVINEVIFSDEIDEISYEGKGYNEAPFIRCSLLKKVHLPINLKRIPRYMFYGCSALNEITIPNNCKIIGTRAFYQCTSLTSLIIPDSVEKIQPDAFRNCTGLKTLTLPITTELIIDNGNYSVFQSNSAKGPFYNNNIGKFIITAGNKTKNLSFSTTGYKEANPDVDEGSLATFFTDSYYSLPWGSDSVNTNIEIVIQEGVEKIWDYYFYNSAGITTVSFPSSIKEIGIYAFAANKDYNQINIISLNPSDKLIIKEYAFYNCKAIKTLILSKNVNSIKEYAFFGCSNINNMTIPMSASFSETAFTNVTNITNIKFVGNGNGIINYTSSTYNSTPWYLSRSSLETVVIDDTVTEIGDYAFYGNTGLATLTIPNSVKIIGKSAFRYCSNISEIYMPISLNIEEAAFANTGRITNINITKGTGVGVDYDSTTYKYTPWYVSRSKNPTITMSPEITRLGDYTFCDSSLTNSLEFDDVSVGAHCFENSSVNGFKYGKLSLLDENAFYGCTSLIDFSRKAGASDAEGEITAVESSAFKDCSNLVSVSLPNSVKEIKENAFSGCSILSTNLITDNIESVGNNAFENCTGLSGAITFTKTKTIGDSAFTGCSFIPSVNITSETTVIGKDAFKDCSSLGSIYIKNKTVSLDEEADSNSIGVPGTTKVYGYKNSTAKTYADAHSYEFVPYYCTLSFDANGIEKDIADREITSGDKYGELPVLEREGYTFTGWYKEKTAVTKVASSDDVDVSDDLTIYAGWTPNDYTVTFDANVDGTCDTANKTVTYDAEYGTLPEAVVTKAGYHFDGWYTESISGNKITSDSIYKIADDSTLYAHYVGNTYKITFDANTGTCDVVSQDAIFDSAYGTLPTAAKRGYSLEGWYTARTDGTKVVATDIYNTIGNVTLYARYTANQYKVTLDTDGGACDKAELTVSFDSVYGDIPAASKTGYTFKGWFTSRLGGTSVSSDDIYKIANNSTIYAVYDANQYKVTFDANGGECDTTEKIYTFGAKYSLMPSAVSRKEGYGFDGWYTIADGGTKVTTASIYSTADDITLYAHYIPNNYDITLDTDGGECDKDKITVTYDSKYGTLPSVTKTGYIFIGWYTDKEAGKKVEADDVYNTLAVNTLYARYEAISYRVTLNANGGTVTPAYVDINYNDKYSNLPIPEKAGYRFVGWTREYVKKNTETKISSGTYGYIYDDSNNCWQSNNKGISRSTAATTWNINLLANETLILKYKVSSEAEYDKLTVYVDDVVKVNAISGSGSWIELPLQLTSGSHTIKAEYVKDSGVDSYDDRAYVSFYVNSNKKITADDLMDIAENHTLNAEYTLDIYKVILDAQGGSCSKSELEVNYNGAYGSLPSPTKAGYTFDGWYTEKVSGSKIYSTSIYRNNADSTLYAHYTAKTYTVRFNSGAGTCTKTSMSVTYGISYGTLPTAANTGHTFDGWYTSSTGGSKINATDKYNFIEDTTLYARYTPNSYLVVFNASPGVSSYLSKSVVYGTQYDGLPTVYRKGYEFVGWRTGVNQGSWVYANTVFRTANNITLYANYLAKTYRITYDANGGECEVKTADIDFDDYYYDLPVANKVGYSFDGWYLDNGDGTRTRVTEDDVFETDDNIILYAQYTPNSYLVTLDAVGGICEKKNISVKYREKYGDMPKPVKENHVFEGWYTEKTGGTQVTAETIMDKSEDSTIFAHWIPVLRTKCKLDVSAMVNATGKMKYITSDAKKASVNGKGIVTGKKVGGSVTITGYTKVGKNLEKTGTVTLIVDAPVVTKKLPVLHAGDKLDVNKEITGNVSKPDRYVSSKTTVVTVDEKGTITAVGKGSAKISIYFGSLVIKTTVKVL